MLEAIAVFQCMLYIDLTKWTLSLPRRLLIDHIFLLWSKYIYQKALLSTFRIIMSGFKYVESNRTSKAQKRRDQKAAKKAEQLKRIEEAEKLDEHKDRKIEQDKLESILKSKGLRLHDIDADGDCLYKAVEHQLSIASDSSEKFTFQELREKTSRYMLENATNFMPFLLDDRGELMSEQEYQNYCTRIAKAKVWGGHLELTAISRITNKSIHVYQADSRTPIVIEAQKPSDRKPILLSFHKHLYHLGEHYNSVVET